MGYVKKFKVVEDKFAAIIRELGDVKASTTDEDINEHWDVKLDVKFDVKAVKKLIVVMSILMIVFTGLS